MNDLPAPRNSSGIGPLEPTRLDVPGMPDVYFCPEVDNFYSRSKRRGMGDAFYRSNIYRMVPTSPTSEPI